MAFRFLLVGIIAVLMGKFGFVYNTSPDSWPSKEELFTGKLKMDTAFVNITSTLNYSINVEGISSDCYECPLQVLKTDVVKNTFIIVKTHYRFKLVIKSGSRSLCSLEYLFGERGLYEFIVKPNITCDLKEVKSPEKSYMPLWIAFVALVGAALLWVVLTVIVRFCAAKCNKNTSELGEPDENENEELKMSGTEPQTLAENVEVEKNPFVKRRLKSLDTFRGIAITLMIFVNYGGGGYYFFGHAVWNGLLVADLVFPWFLWIMGVSITLSFRVLRLRRVSKIKIASKILKRSLILFGLGLFTSNYGNLEFYRIPGVLQRFGVCYLFVAMMQLLLRPTNNEDRKGRWWHKFRDVYGLWKQWIFVFVILAAYLALTFGVDVPGCPKGYLGPGGIGQGFPNAFNCTGGMAGYIDRIALGKHIYRFPTIKELYKTSLPFDPEGILGCLPSIVLVFFGVQAGHIISIHPKNKPRLIRWIIWAVLLTAITLGLCGVSKNEGIIPINKNLWSLSFISATGASSFLLFAVCYLLTDVLGWWNGAPFLYPGMNSILLYVGHGILWRHLPFSWEMDKYGGHGEMLAMNITGTALWCLVAYYLFTKNVFLKV
ncbi:heparan-alpha-glucosaminide N-acetyltransferase-like [Acropora millepora]|uniref:heparan-alpha-glucosaminide N-acetyltransferase-like n=1 Tax=Acropora millepora TaxID=45264 RepID=UPI001CF39A95|nr:heparan-alpha-glucosaminide N-acetyltransferase-like [Acropora millepora]